VKTFVIQPAAAFDPANQGAWSGVPADVYHAAPGESNSGLALLEECPAKYRMMRNGVFKRPQSHDMEMGTIIHTVVNEGGASNYHIRPVVYGKDGKPWHNGANECKAWLAAHADMPVLSIDEARMINNLADLVRATPQAMQLLRGAQTEISACAYNTDLDFPYMLRCRFDILGEDDLGWYFVDTKSTRDASTDVFSREIYNRKYHAQMALYRRVLERLTGTDVRCYFLALEKSFVLPRLNLRQLAPAALDAGDQIIDDRLALLKRCKITNRWPALPDDEGAEEIQFIELPPFARDDDEIEISAS